MCCGVYIIYINIYLCDGEQVHVICVENNLYFIVACDLGRIDCVYVLDVSISIENDINFGFIRDLVTQSAEQLSIGTNDALFSVILFARHAVINFTIPQYTNRADLVNAINEISYFDTSEFDRTGTNIAEALDLLRIGGQNGSIGLRSNANYTHAVFITDGRPNTRDLVEEQLGRRLSRSERENLRLEDEQESISAARRLHASGVYDDVFAIGIRAQRDINFVELGHIASRPEFRFTISDFTQEAFQDVIQQLSEELCNRTYIVNLIVLMFNNIMFIHMQPFYWYICMQLQNFLSVYICTYL